VDEEMALKVRDEIINGDKTDMPGLIRASFGLYNTIEEVDTFVRALHVITSGEYHGQYRQDKASGEFFPVGYEHNFAAYYSLEKYGKV
jgi:hypothetical protein